MITVNMIMHPEDQKAIRVLKNIPYIEKICRSILKMAYEKLYKGENLAMMVKVDETYMPELHEDLLSVANAIGIQAPELYIYNDPVMNAFTFGETNPYVCVSSSLIEKMNREERKAIIAHECGHILCHHVLFNSVAEFIRICGRDLGVISYTMTGPIILALQYWSRRSELSADRCAAAVVGERAFQSSLLKLAVGLSNSGNDPYRLVRQAKEYHVHENNDVWSIIQQNCRMALYSHPQNVNRAYEIDRWKKSCTYKRIRQFIAPNERLYGNIS